MPSEPIELRPTRAADVSLVLSFIRELAAYEHLSDQVTATEAELRTSLFGPTPGAEVVLAFVGTEPAGFAVFFHNFSTFLGRRGLYLEDLYVRPAFRRRGVGLALFRYVAGIAASRQCGRLEWTALDWNEPAVRFYQKLGAVALKEWTLFRLDEHGLKRLAETGSGDVAAANGEGPECV